MALPTKNPDYFTPLPQQNPDYFKPLQTTQASSKQPTSLLEKIAGVGEFLGMGGLGKAGAALAYQFTPEYKDLIKLAREGKITGEQLETALQGVPSNKQVVGSALKTTANILLPTLGKSLAATNLPYLGTIGKALESKAITNQGLQTFLKTATTRATATGGTLGLLSGATALEQDKSLTEAAKAGVVGFGIGAGGSALFSLAKAGVLEGLPRLQGQLSNTAQAVERALDRPIDIQAAQVELKTKGQLGTLKEMQKAVYKGRTNLTNSYNTGKDALAQEFKGVRMGLGDAETNLLGKTAVQLPTGTNLQSMSNKESLELYKIVNEELTPAMRKSSDLAAVALRKFRDGLREKIISTFGGDKGTTAQFLQKYATEKSVLDGANEVLRAYKSNSPRAQTLALRELKRVFDKDKEAFVIALGELEKKTGIKILDRIAALQFKDIIPNKGWDAISTVRKLMLALGGISSPKMAGGFAKLAGTAAQATPGVGTQLGRQTLLNILSQVQE